MSENEEKEEDNEYYGEKPKKAKTHGDPIVSLYE